MGLSRGAVRGVGGMTGRPDEAVERAAGGIVVRISQPGRDALLIDDAYGHVTFAKGHLEAGETWEDAAVREVEEETGVTARILGPLGRVEYRIERASSTIRKQVRLFVMEAVDETTEPVPQAEEIESARYVSWAEAQARHEAQGYANWRWALPKAAALLDWHDGHWEKRLRGLRADDPALVQRWLEARPVLAQLLKTTADEVRTVCPDWSLPSIDEMQARLGLPRPADSVALADAVEHTLLRPDATEPEIDRLCKEAVEGGFHAVCVQPRHVARAAANVSGRVAVCTVVGFPHGATTPRALAAETRAAIADGAREIDMVIPVGAMVEDDLWTVHDHVKAVVDAAREAKDVIVKAILETHYLSVDQVIKSGLAATAAGADMLKTSTGFAPTGARVLDTALMAAVAGIGKVKAAGGIRTRREAEAFIAFGASRIGTSSGPALVRP